jgi:hypothetical protein
VAASLKNEPGDQVDVVDGARGEFAVLVDGHEVARKGEDLPPVEDVLAAVRKAGQATAGARA